MSALARWFAFKGANVSGYDRTESALTRELEGEGIRVHYNDDPSMIPSEVEDTLVVYTPAIPSDLEELRTVMQRGYKVVKRSLVLGEVTADQTCLAVAGTHGKTTTSTLVAHILTESGQGCSAFLGGISRNYGTNMLVSRSDVAVAEADEFDRSFLALHPQIAAITAMDADHLDIYGDLEHYQQAFRDFAAQVKGRLVLKYGLPVGDGDTSAEIVTYALDNAGADFHAENLRLSPDGHYTFDLVHPAGCIRDIRCGTLGLLNVENAVAAAAICLLYGTREEAIRKAIGSYKGVVRRLEEHINTPGLTFLDDYAHHPEELRASISTIRTIFPGRKITAVFQPHLYTRTRDFAPEFAAALSGVDELILLDIYPARELPIPGVSSKIILDACTAPEKKIVEYGSLLESLEKEKIDVLVTFGAGNIDRLVGPLKEMLGKRI